MGEERAVTVRRTASEMILDVTWLQDVLSTAQEYMRELSPSNEIPSSAASFWIALAAVKGEERAANVRRRASGFILNANKSWVCHFERAFLLVLPQS
jgi:hypothetical protein